jgi:hypothetical protein
MLVAGSVIIGMREEGNKAGVEATAGAEPLLDEDAGSDAFRDGDEGEDDFELRTVKTDSEEEGTSDDEDAVLK